MQECAAKFEEHEFSKEFSRRVDRSKDKRCRRRTGSGLSKRSKSSLNEASSRDIKTAKANPTCKDEPHALGQTTVMNANSEAGTFCDQTLHGAYVESSIHELHTTDAEVGDDVKKEKTPDPDKAACSESLDSNNLISSAMQTQYCTTKPAEGRAMGGENDIDRPRVKLRTQKLNTSNNRMGSHCQ